MAKAKQNPWRRGPAQSTNGIPISAQTAVPLMPRGPASGFGFFTPPSKARLNFAAPQGKVPLSAQAGKVKNAAPA